METFLAASKKCMANLSSYQRVRVILGNPTCDLDSVVCTLAMGYLEYQVADAQTDNLGIVPVLNVDKAEFRVKTEVAYYLNSCDVPIDLLTFRDEIDLPSLGNQGKLELVLVDQHTLQPEYSALSASVVEVIDHRPQDPNWLWSRSRFTLGQVGSCATLVAQKVIERQPELLPELARLLRGPILVDTANFSKKAAKATTLDYKILDKIEKVTGSADRDKVYQEIQKAKNDVSKLTPADLLIKDMKIVEGVPIPGFPILVKDFLELAGATEALEVFCASQRSRLAVLMGRKHSQEGGLTRDLAVYSLGADRAANKLIETLTGEQSLGLTEANSSSGPGWRWVLYEQANVRASRKQILPIVQSALSTSE